MNNRERIYQTAKRLYLENGFDNTPNTMIAKEAGVNLGLVTYYFKTKDIIASDMLNNNYEVLYSHVIKYLDREDELLQLVTFFSLHFKITGIDSDYDRFIYEMNKLDLLEKATRDGNLYKLYESIIEKNDCLHPEEKKRRHDYALTASYGVMRALTLKQYEGELDLSKDELFEICVNEMLYALKIDSNPLLQKSLLNSADSITDRILEECRTLRSVKNYLYQEIPVIVCEQ
ncbi:TetR/AcrR family transcriptional regulator [Eubacteriaceae bacterium ES3]|nr:TetR/AcrR family transcriptional regulator [Eubacteriaceae bacterium ES3]